MPRDLTLLDLAERRRSLIFYPLGLSVYALVIVAMFPTFRNDSSLTKLTEGNDKILALFGAPGPLTSPTGWLNGNLYGNFVPLIVLLVTIGFGASSLAGQNERGVLGLVATHPVSRRNLVLARIVSLAVLATPISLATLICVLIGRTFDVTVDYGALIGVSIAVIGLGVLFGTMALAIGALTGTRSTALGITSGIAALSYLISSLAPAITWVHSIRWVSPFWWVTGAGQLATGVGLGDALALAGSIIAFGGLAIVAAQRMDIR